MEKTKGRLRTWIRHHRRPLFLWGSLGVLAGYSLVYGWVTWAPSPAEKRVQLADSRELAYRWLHIGDPSAPPVILIHGAPANAASWNRLAKTIPPDFKLSVLAVDRLGYGNATPFGEVSLAAHSAAIHQLILGLDRKPIVVGHSYGGPVALRLAADYPEGIQATVLVAGACSPFMKDTVWLRELIDRLGPLVPRPWHHANAELLALTGENRAMAGLLPRVTCPVTVVHGTWDPVCPYDMTVDYLSQALPNSSNLRIKTLEHTGHNIHLSDPEIVLAEIERIASR